MGLDIDFAKLAPQDVLDLAIFAENEAQESYDQLADLMDRRGSEDAASFFRLMASVEGRHRDQITAKRNARYSGAARNLADRAFWQVEVPEPATAADDFTLLEALQLAYDAEVSAHDYYAGAIEYVTDGEIEELFEELRVAEAAHQYMIQEYRAKLT